MKIKIVTLISLLIFSRTVLAHGMNQLGPHGGYIKMPGAFHTELVDKENQMHVYLLDINFKNPTSANSSVKITYKGSTESEFTCTSTTNYFVCNKPSRDLKNIKEIVIKALRSNNKGGDAVYLLPLQLEGGVK